MIPGSREGSLKDRYLLLKFLKLHGHSKPDQYILCSYTVILFWWSAWFYLKLIRCPFLGKTDFLLFHSLWRSSSSPSHFTTPRPLPTHTHTNTHTLLETTCLVKAVRWRSRVGSSYVPADQHLPVLFCFVFLSEQGILWARLWFYDIKISELNWSLA